MQKAKYVVTLRFSAMVCWKESLIPPSTVCREGRKSAAHRLAKIVKPASLCPYIMVSSQEDVQQKVELSLYVALD